MSKNKNRFFCLECGFETMQWSGKCPTCNEWNTLEEIDASKAKFSTKTSKIKNVTSLSEMKNETVKRQLTGINEFDRVMGGGISLGSITLIGGEPGVGKSTLLLEVINRYSINNIDQKVLYVSGEESTAQVANRAKRLGISSKNILILNEGRIQDIFDVVYSIKPALVVIDSIQTTYSSEIAGMPGSLSQLKEVTHEIIKEFKPKKITAIIVGHITKEGGLAGPKLLEHMVDTVVYFEGNRTGEYRLLRTNKNRFGNTDEIGIFKMTNKGLIEMKNQHDCFINNLNDDHAGRSVTCVNEGTRNIFMEIQALVVENKNGNCKRSSVGIDQSRILMLIGVIEKYLSISLNYYDIYINVAGGLKSTSTSSDLSVIASILSSYKLKPIKNNEILVGEVGLCGEIRASSLIQNKIKEIKQMNYKKIYIAKNDKIVSDETRSSKIIEVETINDLYKKIFIEA